MENSLYGSYRTDKFTDIFSSYDDFKNDFNDTVFTGAITDDNLEILFYLIYAEYGNSHIANSDPTQFEYKLFSTIWMYGPTWEKKLDYQSKIRALTDTQLLEGSKSIYNHAYNPGTTPTTSSLEEVTYINDQNTTNFKRSKLDAYFQASSYLEQNFTKEFLNRFKKLFLQIVEPQEPLLYENEE